jgi:ubiquinone/menaquinone biosynthesis C-methylase UbiE
MPESDVTRHRARMPEGTQRILDARSLYASHRRLSELLRPGMRVLDAGCGTGAITRDIAAVTGDRGLAVGVDLHPGLIRQARRQNGQPARFVAADLYRLPFSRTFDIATAARVLQWLAEPEAALRSLCAAVRPGGRVVILDYNHEKIAWKPPPPARMRAFYAAFLRWRAEAGMDNAIADHLAALMARAGMADIRISPQHETTARTDAGFVQRLGIWAEVAATRGRQMVEDGMLTEAERAEAEAQYRAWIGTEAVSQRLYLLAVEGQVPETG